MAAADGMARDSMGSPRQSIPPSLSFDPFTDASNSPVTDLPLELVYKIFDILRSHRLQHVSLVLTKKRFYAVLRCLYGSVPLRLKDPNDLEWNVELGPGKSSRETSWLLASQKPRGPSSRRRYTAVSSAHRLYGGRGAKGNSVAIAAPTAANYIDNLYCLDIIAAGGRAYREILSLDEARLAAGNYCGRHTFQQYDLYASA
ncbi:hypothetical protein ED733_006639 [Metarhizium rileyi]|uniref:F-box domain-containing protein n=1 Tax=Metarhizium rileyi (strain RCEF 4871) TaxID=1649241 RepID=A0A5C6GGJ9_METRR|nr:hypothetical protein ED733_006639 [Metarhizium rileyi]